MSINDLLTFASSAQLAIESTAMVTVDDELAARTGLKAGTVWLAVRGYRHAENTAIPVCTTEYYINNAFAAVRRLLQRHNGPIFPLIEDLFEVSIIEVRQEISSVLLTPELADALCVEAGTAALEMQHTYTTADGEVAQVTVNTSSWCRHSMTIRRSEDRPSS